MSNRSPETDSDVFFDENKRVRQEDTIQLLNKHYKFVKERILAYQSPATGLFPRLDDPKSVETHVRDNVYCAVALWALRQAYRRIDSDLGRSYELGQSAVKCMRGILYCWMRQCQKIEDFKSNQIPENAFYSKFHLHTGDPLDGTPEYGHLQLDAVSLYLLYMVQMIDSKLQLVYTSEEVNFIQNLVYYIERTYRTPDFGMWERGSKYNNGSPELHASSIGLTKAALEAMNGFNVFGIEGTNWSVIYVDIDAHNRNRTIFETLLPRESSSKNTDAALMCVVGFPGFSMHDSFLVEKTICKCVRKLRGRYGFKRFLRDGAFTVLEDTSRKYYHPSEIKNFDGVECEWPIWFVYMIVSGIFLNKRDQVEEYKNALESVLIKDSKGEKYMPHYYYVPQECLEEERKNPGSTEKRPMPGEVRHLWDQAMYAVCQMLLDDVLKVSELDPIRRYLRPSERPKPNQRYSAFQGYVSDLAVQVVLVSESVRLQQLLATYGIRTQTPHQIEPIQIWPPGELVKAYSYLGACPKLGLTGRPLRPIGVLGTSKIYKIMGKTVLCYPITFEISDFYMSQDMHLLLDDIKSDLFFLSKCWKLQGRPIYMLLIREEMARGENAMNMLTMLAAFKQGEYENMRLQVGRLQSLISSGCIEHLDFLDTEDLKELQFVAYADDDTKSFLYKSLTDVSQIVLMPSEETPTSFRDYEKLATSELTAMTSDCDSVEVMGNLLFVIRQREGPNFRLSDGTYIDNQIEKLTRHAAKTRKWSVVRLCSSALSKVVDSLAPSLAGLLVKGRHITIGVFGKSEYEISEPIRPNEAKEILYSYCFPYEPQEAVLQQEMIIHMATYCYTEPQLFDGILKVRLGWFVQAMKTELQNRFLESPAEHSLFSLSPYEVKQLIYHVLTCNQTEAETRTIYQKRILDGALNRVPLDFYECVWHILERTPGGIKCGTNFLPQQPTLFDMTMYELKFSLKVEEMLSRIALPEYRQIVVELFMVASMILRRNPELQFADQLDVERVIVEAFELYAKDQGLQPNTDMRPFYSIPAIGKNGTVAYLARACFNSLLTGDISKTISNESCRLS